MSTLTIDGQSRLGTYRVDCDCGAAWSGTARSAAALEFSPALPIAEATVHHTMEHNMSTLNVRFTQRFRLWLRYYWERDSMLRTGQLVEPRHDA